MRLPLIDGHGNFGSIDGDPPAAMRYDTSCKCYGMLAELNKNTVDIQSNYDESLTEPSVLPARFPKSFWLTVSSGIAVGYGYQHFLPHNPLR